MIDRRRDATILTEIGKPTYTLDPEKGIKTRQFPTEEAAVLAETFLRRLAREDGVNVPRVIERAGSRVVMEYLPGRPQVARPNAEMIDAIARLQARIHAVDWPDYADRDACAENYRRQFKEYVEVYRLLGLIRDGDQKEMLKQFEARIPWRLHPALIHDDLWGGNVLSYQGDLFLIDFASVKFLSLESDLLNSSRYFHTPFERLFTGAYSLRTRYIRVYAEGGQPMGEVVRALTTNRPFYFSFNAMRKGANMLRRKPDTERERLRGLSFAVRRLRQARRFLGL